MKRVAAVVAFLVVILPSVSACAAPSLRHQLLAANDVPGWSKYYIAAAETEGKRRIGLRRDLIDPLNTHAFKKLLGEAISRLA